MTARQPRPRGGIGAQRDQYATIGGGQTSGSPEAQTSERSTIKEPERPGIQESEISDAQASKRSDAQASKPKRHKQTVYLLPEHDKWIRHRVADTREEISDVINEALSYYRTNATGGD